MKRIYFILALCLAAGITMAQETLNPLLSTPYIEVTGEADMEIIPNEIYLTFTLQERYDGKTKTDLNQLEKDLKKAVSAAGFNLQNLTVADASSDYVDIRRRKKDVLAAKNYQMKISSTSELIVIWDILDELKAENASIDRVDHSEMEAYKKEVKINAVKNAKEKATYLLGALDEKTGSVLFIQEQQNYMQPFVRKSLAMAPQIEAANISMASKQESLSFQKLKLQYKVFVRFAIE